jgi:hypothetical protein
VRIGGESELDSTLRLQLGVAEIRLHQASNDGVYFGNRGDECRPARTDRTKADDLSDHCAQRLTSVVALQEVEAVPILSIET